jgi:arsenate reductase
MAHPINVLFVCVENSNRSQMAEAFARLHGGEGVTAFSAGSRPSGIVNPKAIDALPSIEFDAVITMGCGDACPHIRSHFNDDWPLLDPSNMSPAAYNEICHAINSKVKTLLSDLGLVIDTELQKRERT